MSIESVSTLQIKYEWNRKNEKSILKTKTTQTIDWIIFVSTVGQLCAFEWYLQNCKQKCVMNIFLQTNIRRCSFHVGVIYWYIYEFRRI